MKIELDVKKYWEENEQCMKPFSTDKKRVPLSFWLDDHFLLETMELPSTLQYYKDKDYAIEINKKFNALTRAEIGRTFFPETRGFEDAPKRFEILMGAKWELREGGTPSLEGDVKDAEELEQVVIRMENLDMKKEMFSENYKENKEKYEKETGKKAYLGGGSSRGPATMATSILGTSNTCYFLYDEPELMDRFFAALGRQLVEYNKILMIESYGKILTSKYMIYDDFCSLFPPEMYLRYCAPVMQKLYGTFACSEGAVRYQHSDSDMAHLMPILSDLGVNQVNLGPNISAAEIRKAMPKALIYGQIPPFLLRNGTDEEVIESVKKDISEAAGDGGLVLSPAGSLSGGTSFERIRLYMWAAEEYGRY